MECPVPVATVVPLVGGTAIERSPLKITFVKPYATDDGTLSSPESRDVYSFYRPPPLCRSPGHAAATRGTSGRPRLHDEILSGQEEGSRRDLVAPGGIRPHRDLRHLAQGATRLCPGRPDPGRQSPGADRVRRTPSTALPDEALRHADAVVLREGDRTLVELARRIREDREHPGWHEVDGIAYRDEGKTLLSSARLFLTRAEFNALPFPEYPEEVLRGITNQVMITSRGCPHGCRYCAVIENFGRGYRALAPERMLDYYEYLVSISDKPIFIGDDNFTADPDRVKRWCELVLALNRKRRVWTAQVRVEAARDRELLTLMKRAGCNTVMIGLESIDDETLRRWNKRSSREKNEQAIRGFLEARIDVHGMFMLGAETESRDSVRKTVDFARSSSSTRRSFSPSRPCPVRRSPRDFEKEGCILNRAWHLYDGQHVLVEPKGMKAAELQNALLDAHRAFYSFREAFRHLLFPAYQHRFYNAMIRFAGRRLVRKICRVMKPHTAALENLDRWAQGFDEQLKVLKKRLASLSES